MVSRRSRALTIFCALVAVFAAGHAVAKKPRPTVTITGTAYEFNNVDTFLDGGRVKVAEFPKLSAPINSNGAYSIRVPDKSKVTLYAVRNAGEGENPLTRGYHSVYTQTFTTNGANLQNVNLQTPTNLVYGGLADLIDVELDPATGNPVKCAIVTTFSTRNVRGLDYAGFVGYGAHGVPGATATGSPALPDPIYFNDQVLPDPNQPNSSEDGGIIWKEVPAGIYRISASKAGTSFASFTATCKNGRVVNANPPWGLHQLAEDNPAAFNATWAKAGRNFRLTSLEGTDTGAGWRIGLRCITFNCNWYGGDMTPTDNGLDLFTGFRKPLVLRPGQALEATVESPGPGMGIPEAQTFNGWTYRWTATKRSIKQTKLCLPLGDLKAVKTCP